MVGPSLAAFPGQKRWLLTLRLYLKELFRFSKAKLLTNLGLMVTLGMTEGIGLMILIPFFDLAGIFSGDQVSVSRLTIWVGEVFRHTGLTLNLPVVLVAYISLIFGQSWVQRCQSQLNVVLRQSFTNSLNLRLFRAATYTRWPFWLVRRKSDLAKSLTTDMWRISFGTDYFLQILSIGMIALIQIIIAIAVAPGLTAVALGGGIILFFWLQPLIRKSRRMGMDLAQLNRRLFLDVSEHLNGIKEVKSYGIEERQIADFARDCQVSLANSVQFNKIQCQTDMFYKVSAALMLGGFFYMAVAVFKLNAPEFLLLILIFARLWPRFSAFQVALQYVMLLLPAFREVIELEKQCLAEQERPLTQTDSERITLHSGIEFSNVSFSYDSNGENIAVNEVNLKLPANRMTALVGGSGSGKSTLAELLMGLLIPQRGNILVDGEPFALNSSAWRQSIGYVPQDAFLFNVSIRDNLLRFHPEAGEAQIWETLELVALADMVRRLPEGLDTVVGDRGMRLSGGERQRLVLARALLRKPAILILDEATSSLDLENEQRIQQAIESLQGKMTLMVIAHRLTTVRQADQIYVMDLGRIIERGSYESLMANPGSCFYAMSHSGKE